MNTVYKYIYPALAVIIFALVAFIGYTLIQESKEDDSSNTNNTEIEQTASNSNQQSIYTLDEVALGSTKDNCLMAFEGKVYFITEEYINSLHPAGAKPIINNCGKDVTEIFKNAHNNSSTSVAELMNYEVGILVENTEFSSDETEQLIPEFTREEIAAANDINERCLMIYEGSVYEIPSNWASLHPGGSSNIISNCGQDITSQFDKSHRGSKQAIQQLSEYFVGTIKQ